MRYDPKRPKAMDDHKDDHAVVACCYYLMSHSADNRSDIIHGKRLPRWMQPKNDGSKKPLGWENVRAND